MPGCGLTEGQNVRSSWSWVAGENSLVRTGTDKEETRTYQPRDLGDHCSQEGRMGGRRQVHLSRWMDTGRNGHIDERTQIGRNGHIDGRTQIDGQTHIDQYVCRDGQRQIRQMDRQMDRWMDRWTDIDTHRKMYREKDTNWQKNK